ncbi:MAG TPA: branched-chain amino acid ABC transporter permease [Candidatus Deferrimicrobiaceae bacterium]|nr:branched-chain amino acid ABC transporter permease [Candidatus Deferrimicrobiaceae bacterium]
MPGSLRNLIKILAAYALLSGGVFLLAATGIANPYWVRIFELACVVAISAQGLNIIYGYTGLFSLGHAAFYGIGAYVAAYLMKTYGGQSQAAFLVALLAGGGAAAVVALLIGLPTLRLTSDYLGIATLGFGIIMKVIFDNADSFLPDLGGARGMTGIAKMTTVPWVVFFLLASLLAVRNMIHSSYGRAILSIREDEIAAEMMGIDTFRYKMAGFVTGCAFAGVAGGLYAHLYTFLHPSNFDFFKSIDILVIVVLGGLGNMSGTVAASFGWVFLLEGLRVVLPPGYVELRWVLIPVLLIVTMLLRPQGLFGSREFPFLRGRLDR